MKTKTLLALSLLLGFSALAGQTMYGAFWVDTLPQQAEIYLYEEDQFLCTTPSPVYPVLMDEDYILKEGIPGRVIGIVIMCEGYLPLKQDIFVPYLWMDQVSALDNPTGFYYRLERDYTKLLQAYFGWSYDSHRSYGNYYPAGNYHHSHHGNQGYGGYNPPPPPPSGGNYGGYNPPPPPPGGGNGQGGGQGGNNPPEPPGGGNGGGNGGGHGGLGGGGNPPTLQAAVMAVETEAEPILPILPVAVPILRRNRTAKSTRSQIQPRLPIPSLSSKAAKRSKSPRGADLPRIRNFCHYKARRY